MDLLLWARGPGFNLAVMLLIFGTLLRLAEIYSLGRKRDQAPPHHRHGGGWRTLVTRSVPHRDQFRRSPVTYLSGYLFHLGLFVVIFLYAPHVEIFRSVLGVGWPALPSPVVDGATLITLIALLVVLFNRIFDPVKRFLSGVQDYLAWTVTFLPVLTGYLAYHHLLLDYTTLLALHILSAELLLALLPFTKLAHAFSLFISRWYTGTAFARRGVAS